MLNQELQIAAKKNPDNLSSTKKEKVKILVKGTRSHGGI